MENAHSHFSQLVSPPTEIRPLNQSHSRLFYLKNSSSSYKKLKKYLITDASLTFIHKHYKIQQKIPIQKSQSPLILKQESTVRFLPPLNTEGHKIYIPSNVKVDKDLALDLTPSMQETLKTLPRMKIHETQRLNIKTEKFQMKKLSTMKNKIKQLQNMIAENETICGWESNFPEEYN